MSSLTWNIIFSDINRNKPFSLLRPGTEVTIDPQNFDLSFNRNPAPVKAEEEVPVLSAAAMEPLQTAATTYFGSTNDFSERLAEAVKSYIGKPYSEIDCYGLVIRGLKTQGIQYGGKGGLRENMEFVAEMNGLPVNAYQNGEGLIKTSGREVYSRSFANINDTSALSDRVFTELEPKLQKGMILAFSTPTRGHTGIISRKNGEWTYINSGLMDHRVDSGRITRRVGEERLSAEINNWFKLARSRNEPLKVTVGMLEEEKLRSFYRDHSPQRLSEVHSDIDF